MIRNEVPDSTIIKCLTLENEKLKAELETKNKAIDKFKKWQKEMIVFKISKWIGQAKQILSDPQDLDTLEELRKFSKHHRQYVFWMKKLENERKRMLNTNL